MPSLAERLATELQVRPTQVETTIRLLDEGATVPFIARYRKEVTQGLDDAQLRTLQERLLYLRELEARRATVLASIREQGKLTPELEALLLGADTKVRLEDLYLPYKPKRRTKAMLAREAGLEPLADALLADPSLDPVAAAQRYVDPGKEVADADAALAGARHILMERFAEDPALLGSLREHVRTQAQIASTVVAGKEQEAAKFSDYFGRSEALARIPSHRALALLRGRNAGFLDVRLDLEPVAEGGTAPAFGVCAGKIARRFCIEDKGRPADRWLLETVRLCWKVKLASHLEVDLMVAMRERAEQEAIAVFGKNLRDLLLAAPAGARVTLGLDPGIRTGVKAAVVDATGKLLETVTVYPHEPRNEWERALVTLAALVRKHDVQLVAIGNGTASRETDRLVVELVKHLPGKKLDKLVVSEAGASVYSASEFASREFPELDVSLRGAVSIARRLQDPLAELVKIEPKALGVGQYQHDVDQGQLARTLDAVVEDCVNAVGVDVNLASVPLLARVSGLNETLARNIVAHRDAHGAFGARQALLGVPRLGPKTFELCAGFLRIQGGSNPLDASAVHPEAYPVVERILARTGRSLREVLGKPALLRGLQAADFADATFGLPTVQDILQELEKPGRDPRPEFKTAKFQEGVETLADLKPDMVLEGVVTNVTNFGAFVDIGVHQDGLVHISALSHKFVTDPREVVKAGDVVQVKVLAVDTERKRIALTMKLTDTSREAQAQGPRRGGTTVTPARQPEREVPSPLAAALAKLTPRKG